jgi:ribosomal protein S16
MKAYIAVKFLGQIQTDELCHYIGKGSEPSGNVKLLRKKNMSVAMEHRGRQKERSATHGHGPFPLTPTGS